MLVVEKLTNYTMFIIQLSLIQCSLFFSRLVNRVQENPDEWQRVLKEFALQLSLTVTPPPGNVALVSH